MWSVLFVSVVIPDILKDESLQVDKDHIPYQLKLLTFFINYLHTHQLLHGLSPPLPHTHSCAHWDKNRVVVYLFIFFYNRNAFRNGLIQGSKLVVYPILQWLLERLDELKKRAYLARFMVRLEIPPDQLADQELYDLNENVRVFSLVKSNILIMVCNF